MPPARRRNSRRILWRIGTGSALVLVAYLQLLYPIGKLSLQGLGLFWLAFFLGSSLICDGLALAITRRSLISTLLRSPARIVAFILVTTIGTLILEGVAVWLDKLWLWPGLSLTKYAIIFVPGGAFYFLMIAESYLVTKGIFDLLLRGRKIVTRPYRWEDRVFVALGALGLPLSALGLGLMAIYRAKHPGGTLPFIYVLIMFTGVWFLLEFLQHNQKKSSLLKDILHVYPAPVLSILASSVWLGLIVESLNVVHQAWAYTNWEWQSVQVVGTPVLVFVAWVIHYVLFLSIFRALAGKEAEDVWRGDLIK